MGWIQPWPTSNSGPVARRVGRQLHLDIVRPRDALVEAAAGEIEMAVVTCPHEVGDVVPLIVARRCECLHR